MESLSTWYNSKARRPLIALIVLIILVQVSYLGFVIYANEKKYSDLVQNIERVASIALMQKNRVILETLLYTVSENPDFSEFYICERGLVLIAFPPDVGGCVNIEGGVLYRVDERLVHGFEEYKIVSKVKRFKVPAGYLFVVGVTAILSILGVALVTVVAQRFEREILAPIVRDFEGDATERISEFAALRSRRVQVVELARNKAMADMARQVAHDIRSPISALQIFIQKRQSVLGDEAGMLTAITGRIISIADSLLERSRILNSSSMYVDALIEETKRVLAEKAIRFPRANLSITTDVGSNRVNSVKVDRNEWGRIISNLLENSIEASDPGAVKAVLSITKIGQNLQIDCRDFGRGIDKANLERLILSGGTFGKANGNGLGLSHLKQMISRAEGSWEITSEIGTGTEIRITLPLS